MISFVVLGHTSSDNRRRHPRSDSKAQAREKIKVVYSERCILSFLCFGMFSLVLLCLAVLCDALICFALLCLALLRFASDLRIWGRGTSPGGPRGRA